MNCAKKGMAPLRRSRNTGALFALHAGDALSAPLESKPHTAIRSRHPGPNAVFPRTLIVGASLFWPPGTPLDDTYLARAILLTYRNVILNGNDMINQAAEHSCVVSRRPLARSSAGCLWVFIDSP
jgi:ADP-ribosylglycohydrolase